MIENVRSSDEHRLGVTYSRVSTKLQAKNSKGSIEYQKNMREVLIRGGWKNQEIVDFDDLGVSGTFGIERDGFERLLQMIIEKRVGAIAFFDISRIARNQSDIAKLIDFCITEQVLLIDRNRVFRPWLEDDMTSLRFAGLLSTLELSGLKKRMHAGKMTVLLAGLMKIPIPLGYVYTTSGKIVMDPDNEIQAVIKKVFELMSIYKSAYRVTKEMNNQNYKMITLKRIRDAETGLFTGEVIKIYKQALSERVRSILRNPTYAGAYCWGRIKHEKKFISLVRARIISKIVSDYKLWPVFIRDHHPEYISWETHRDYINILRSNAFTKDTPGYPREGNALLQGILYCGKCHSNTKMEVNYNKGEKNTKATTYYRCCIAMNKYSHPLCQYVSGKIIDGAVLDQILAAFININIKNLISIQQISISKNSITIRMAEKVLNDSIISAKQKENMYRKVMNNNFSIDVVEKLLKDWDKAEKLVEEHRKRLHDQQRMIDNPSQSQIEALNKLPKTLSEIFSHEGISMQDKKLIVRKVIDRVIVLKNKNALHFEIIWKSGASTRGIAYTSKPPPPKRTDQKLIDYILQNRLGRTFAELAEILNSKGFVSFDGTKFSGVKVCSIYHSFVKKEA